MTRIPLSRAHALAVFDRRPRHARRLHHARRAERERIATTAAAPALPANCTPIETRAPNATGQKPAFPGQTRICGVSSNVAFDVVVVAKGLEHPWSVEPLPDGQLLVTERPGRLRLVSASGQIGEPIEGILPVAAGGQGGLLDVALSPTFATDRTIFWTFSEPRDGGNGTAIARGVLSADNRRVDSVRVIFRVLPTYNGRQHFGSRIAFGPDGMLYASFGERSDTPMRPNAQKLDGHLGKVIRIRPDGTVPTDNPFVGRADAKPEIWDPRPSQSAGARVRSAGSALAGGARHARRRRAEPDPEGKELRLATAGVRHRVLGSAADHERTRPVGAERRGDGAAGLLLGSRHRAVRAAVLHGKRVPGVARQCVHRRAGEQATRAPRARRHARRRARSICSPIAINACATCGRGRTVCCIS